MLIHYEYPIKWGGGGGGGGGGGVVGINYSCFDVISFDALSLVVWACQLFLESVKCSLHSREGSGITAQNLRQMSHKLLHNSKTIQQLSLTSSPMYMKPHSTRVISATQGHPELTSIAIFMLLRF